MSDVPALTKAAPPSPAPPPPRDWPLPPRARASTSTKSRKVMVEPGASKKKIRVVFPPLMRFTPFKPTMPRSWGESGVHGGSGRVRVTSNPT
ncbi:MAG: hypothetical protein MUE42_05555 [Opitutaceae bacterium]|nr:hypothetical protein [Opitutaceae bacterium]